LSQEGEIDLYPGQAVEPSGRKGGNGQLARSECSHSVQPVKEGKKRKAKKPKVFFVFFSFFLSTFGKGEGQEKK